MNNCIIHPIPLWEMKMTKSALTFRQGFEQTINPICYVWYIEGTKERIIVDAGLNTKHMSSLGAQAGKEIQTIDTGLNRYGLTVNDIDIVIITHLHSDHVGSAYRFSKARFLIQKRELDFGRNPHPAFASGYNREYYDTLNFQVIDGDFKVSDEVTALFTPGHTPGSQSVAVHTRNGTAVISGCCSLRENFDPPASFKMDVIPSGTPSNAFENYESLLRIKKLADIVIPNHDRAFLKVNDIP